MNIDNILRTMNEYIKDMYDTFGGQSVEYTQAVKQARENIPDDILSKVARQGLDYDGDMPDKPLQFSRGKAAQTILNYTDKDGNSPYLQSLEKLRSQQRETGTAKVQAQRYYTEQKLEKPDENVDLKQVAEQAKQRYDFNSNVNDWYEDIVNDENNGLTDAERQDLKDEYSTLASDYSDPDKRQKIAEKANKLLDKVRKKKAADKAKTEAEKIAAEQVLNIGADIDKII